MDDRSCPENGLPMRRGVRPVTLAYKGRTLTFEMPGWYRDGAEDGLHDHADMAVSDRALNRLKADADDLLPPEEIRRVRRKLCLTQEQAGDLIGGGPRAFQKYEAGDLLPSRGISNFLRVLDVRPDVLDVLRARHLTAGSGRRRSPKAA